MGSTLRNTNVIFCQPFKHYISLTLMAIHCVYSTREHPLFQRHRVWHTYGRICGFGGSEALARFIQKSSSISQSQKHIPVIKTLTLRPSLTSNHTTCSSQWIPFTSECIFAYFIVWLARTARETQIFSPHLCCSPTNTATHNTLLDFFFFSAVNWAFLKKRFCPFGRSCYSSHRTDVWFANSHTLRTSEENVTLRRQLHGSIS